MINAPRRAAVVAVTAVTACAIAAAFVASIAASTPTPSPNPSPNPSPTHSSALVPRDRDAAMQAAMQPLAASPPSLPPATTPYGVVAEGKRDAEKAFASLRNAHVHVARIPVARVPVDVSVDVLADARADAVSGSPIDAFRLSPRTLAILDAALADADAFEPLAIAELERRRRVGAAARARRAERRNRLAEAQDHQRDARRDARGDAQQCLAEAIYFESATENLAGQMAVAGVVMNRVKSSRYPNSVCGVVYQNAHRAHRCQFSFACDLKPEIPYPGEAWNTAKRLAAQALEGRINFNRYIGIDASTLHYHADYVSPSWSRSGRPAAKIGRHIFYSGL